MGGLGFKGAIATVETKETTWTTDSNQPITSYRPFLIFFWYLCKSMPGNLALACLPLLGRRPREREKTEPANKKKQTKKKRNRKGGLAISSALASQPASHAGNATYARHIF